MESSPVLTRNGVDPVLTRNGVDYLRRFVPDLEDIVSFEELVKEENLSEESQQASK